MDRKRYVVLAVLVIISGFIGGSFSSFLFQAHAEANLGDRIITKEIVIEDEYGKVRAILSALQGQTGLAFFDNNGTSRAILGLHNEKPVLEMDGINQEKMNLGIDKKGPMLQFSQGVKQGLTLGMTEYGRGQIDIFEKNKRALSLGVNNQGVPLIDMFDGDVSSLKLAGKAKGNNLKGISVMKNDGSDGVKIGIISDVPIVFVKGKNESTGLISMARNGQVFIGVSNESGQTLWGEP